MKHFFTSVYITNRVYIALCIIIVWFVVAFFFPIINIVPRVLLMLLIFFIILDALLLYSKQQPITILRTLPERMSNGDANLISVSITNHYNYAITTMLIEELPEQFQKRDFMVPKTIASNENALLQYTVTPATRGIYHYGSSIVMVSNVVGLLQRRVAACNNASIPTYPSYKKMSRFALSAISNQLTQYGTKQLRKMGSSNEFEQIKEYVKGDDVRTINWKASARKQGLMVNTYTDEKSQQVYCIINKGRVMQMPFDGLSLLDHAINATLILTNVALSKKDKAGLITFNNKIGSLVPADAKATQLNLILEHLYKQETTFLESDFEKLYSLVRTKITQRSLLVLFTNFETYSSMQRELPYLKKISAQHLLLVVFFENTVIKQLLEHNATTIEQVYTKTIAEKLLFEKRKIVKDLNNNGILTLLTTPQALTVNAVNKYVDLKMRRAI